LRAILYSYDFEYINYISNNLIFILTAQITDCQTNYFSFY